MKITIKQKDIELRKTFRSVIAFEQASGKIFNPQTISDTILYFYCVIIASDDSIELTFDEFIMWLDDSPTALTEFTQWIVRQSEIESTLSKKKSVRTKKDTQ